MNLPNPLEQKVEEAAITYAEDAAMGMHEYSIADFQAGARFMFSLMEPCVEALEKLSEDRHNSDYCNCPNCLMYLVAEEALSKIRGGGK